MLLQYKKQVYRLANILDLLIQNDRIVSVCEIANVNECTERTVYNDIYYIMAHWNDLIHLDLSHASLLSSHTSVGNIHYIYESIIARQPCTQLLKLLIEKPNMGIDYYSEEVDMSEQSTRKIFKEIDDSLKAYDIALNPEPRKYEIIGDEAKVRLFIASFYQYFQRNFMLPSVELEYESDIMRYFDVNFKLKSYLNRLVETSYLRFNQGRCMNPDVSECVADDVKEMLRYYISVLHHLDVQVQPLIPELIANFEGFGYHFDAKGVEDFRIMFSHILHMRDNVYSINDMTLHAVQYYIQNYSHVNKRKFNAYKSKLEMVLATVTNDYQKVLSNLIFNIDVMQPAVSKPRILNMMVYSDISTEHAAALQSHLSTLFPNNIYTVYTGPVECCSPQKENLESFYLKHDCDAIITTCDFRYKIDYPKITVSSYLVGSDIGRLYDYFNSLQ